MALMMNTVLMTAAPMMAMAQTAPETGKEIFEQMCAGCHGTYGNGQEGTKSGFVPRIGTLANKEYMASVPDDYLKLIIKKGGAYMGKIATMQRTNETARQARRPGIRRRPSPTTARASASSLSSGQWLPRLQWK